MSEIIKKVNRSTIRWFWSLKPGNYVDNLTGKSLYSEDMVRTPWHGTLLEWNLGMIDVVESMSRSEFKEQSDEDVLYLPSTMGSKYVSSMLGGWHGKTVVTDETGYNIVLISSEDKDCTIEILDINEKGNIS